MGVGPKEIDSIPHIPEHSCIMVFRYPVLSPRLARYKKNVLILEFHVSERLRSQGLLSFFENRVDVIGIVDYGTGNIGSVANMIKKAGGRTTILHLPSQVSNIDKLILPGIGSYDTAMRALRDGGWVETLKEFVLHQQRPYLGICLGMQVLFEGSEEGREPGLSWLKGHLKRFRFEADSRRKVPHMGWNNVNPVPAHPLFESLEAPRFYFVHTYYLSSDSSNAGCYSQYGHEFVSGVWKDNIFGVQFHPEKSHKFGLKLMQNFVRLEDSAT
jgi:glutamine amidotransferase